MFSGFPMNCVVERVDCAEDCECIRVQAKPPVSEKLVKVRCSVVGSKIDQDWIKWDAVSNFASRMEWG